MGTTAHAEAAGQSKASPAEISMAKFQVQSLPLIDSLACTESINFSTFHLAFLKKKNGNSHAIIYISKAASKKQKYVESVGKVLRTKRKARQACSPAVNTSASHISVLG